MSDAQEVFVGIDVSKELFDVAVRPGDERGRGSQDEAGVASPSRVVSSSCVPTSRLWKHRVGMRRLITATLRARWIADRSESLHDRSATLPSPWAGWPRGTGSMRR